MPARLIHILHLGTDNPAPDGRVTWPGVSSETFTVRHLQGVDVAKVVDAVRITTLHQGIGAAVR